MYRAMRKTTETKTWKEICGELGEGHANVRKTLSQCKCNKFAHQFFFESFHFFAEFLVLFFYFAAHIPRAAVSLPILRTVMHVRVCTPRQLYSVANYS